MRYHEFTEALDSQQRNIKAQKERAKVQMKNAKREKQMATAADLRLKQKRSNDALSKINRS